jgi:hypothetical protein
VVGVADPYGRIVGFLDRNHYVFFQVAHNKELHDLYSSPSIIRIIKSRKMS